MADVFISFVHEEQRVATAVKELLRSTFAKENFFLSSDEWQIFAGERWLDRIEQELSEARVLLLMLSRESVGRPWVNFEAGAAWLRGIGIVPACYAGLSKGALPKPYSNLQALDLPADTDYLIRSVAHHLKYAVPPPPMYFGGEAHKELNESIEELERRKRRTK